MFIEDKDEFFKLLSDSSISVDDAFLVSEDYIQVKYSKKINFKEDSSHSNVVIASYVTAHARCELYNLLDSMQERCLYFDTDSIIFTQNNEEFKPKTGYYLGELTDEVVSLKEPNNYITKFISCGAKNYAYEIFNPDTNQKKYICKVKGLTLNFKTSSIVNFDSMKELLTDFVNHNERKIINVPQFNIKTNNFYEVKSVDTNKIYRINYDRRVLKPDLSSRPFGFKCKV